MAYSKAAPSDGAPTSLLIAPRPVIGRGKGILASMTACMDAEPEFTVEGLVICTPTSRHASSSVISKGQSHVEAIQSITMEETDPFFARMARLACYVPSVIETVKTVPKEFSTYTTSNTLGNNRLRVILESEGLHKSSEIAPQLHAQSRTSTTKAYNITDSFQTSQVEMSDSNRSCKYYNIQHCNAHQTHLRRDCHDNQLNATAKGGNSPSWSRVVKQDAPSIPLDDSWPPLVSSTKSSKNTCNVNTHLVTTHRQGQDSLVYSTCPDTENQFHPLHCHPEASLNDQCWPSLKKFAQGNPTPYDHSIPRKRRTLQPLDDRNISKPRDQKRTAHGGLFKAQTTHFPPIHLMVNKDFIVTSPLKENLLLTIALMEKRPTTDVPDEGCLQSINRIESKRQILVGQFKAFSSFMHFMLGKDAIRVRTESNAGGTSTISESLSVEYFVRRFQARDIVPEMEVEYCSFNWKKVDFICTLYGQRVGVSVTRAMSFPDPKDFSSQMAYRLLHKKLFGLVVARHGVSKRHSFSKCILHVWCETQQTASFMQREYDAVSKELDIADDVVMVLTVADGYHARPIFYEYLIRNALK